MISVRKNEDRGHMKHGWLNTKHSFSFGEYYDPNFMGFRSLRVINEDHIEPSAGFPTHPHHDMEILTYVISGSIAHKDSMGSNTVIPAGDVQIMSAGTGITHSEFNPSESAAIHLLQIWILPQQTGLTPRYEQQSFSPQDKENRLLTIASQNEDGMKVFQDVSIMASVLNTKKSVSHSFKAGRSGWLQLISGEVSVNGISLKAGDAGIIQNEETVDVLANQKSEFILFDLA